MKKAMRFTVILSIWIIGLFTTGMLMTFVNDEIQRSGFFGDIKLGMIKDHEYDISTNKRVEIMVQETSGAIDDLYKWGGRHYWYFWMCTILWLIGAARCAIWVYYYWETKPATFK